MESQLWQKLISQLSNKISVALLILETYFIPNLRVLRENNKYFNARPRH